MQYLTRNMSERYLIRNRTSSPDIDSLISVCMQRTYYTYSIFYTKLTWKEERQHNKKKTLFVVCHRQKKAQLNVRTTHKRLNEYWYEQRTGAGDRSETRTYANEIKDTSIFIYIHMYNYGSLFTQFISFFAWFACRALHVRVFVKLATSIYDQARANKQKMAPPFFGADIIMRVMRMFH